MHDPATHKHPRKTPYPKCCVVCNLNLQSVTPYPKPSPLARPLLPKAPKQSGDSSSQPRLCWPFRQRRAHCVILLLPLRRRSGARPHNTTLLPLHCISLRLWPRRRSGIVTRWCIGVSIVHRRWRLLVVRSVITRAPLMCARRIGVLRSVEGEVVLGKLTVFAAFAVGH